MDALKYFTDGYNCCESIIKSQAKNLDSSVGTAFGGGIVNTNNICGALSGGIITIGYLKGRNSLNEDPGDAKELTQKLLSEFIEQFGKSNCNDLTGCDIYTEEGKKKFSTDERREKCQTYVKFVDDFIRENI